MRKRSDLRYLVLTVGLLPVFAGCVSTPRQMEERMQWQPKNTWLMMVGVLDQQNTDVYGSFDKKDRKDQALLELLLRRGVPKEQAVFLKDKDAGLANIKKEFAALLQKTKKGDFLIVFFDGHGTINKKGEGYFVPYDAPGKGYKGLWRMADAFAQIEEQFNGKNVLMMADCCHAGAMVNHLKKLETTKGYACLSSSESHVTSPDLWTFTESLIEGFEGEFFVDHDEDGLVSLDDLAKTCWRDMVWYYTQETVFATNDHFPKNLQLVAALKKGHKDVGKYFEIRPDGKGRWHRAKAVNFAKGSLKLGYYPDEWLHHVWIKLGSGNIRPMIQKCYAVGDAIEVRWHGKWSPATVVEVDKRRSLNKVRYGGKNPEPDGWYAANHIRLRKGARDVKH